MINKIINYLSNIQSFLITTNSGYITNLYFPIDLLNYLSVTTMSLSRNDIYFLLIKEEVDYVEMYNISLNDSTKGKDELIELIENTEPLLTISKDDLCEKTFIRGFLHLLDDSYFSRHLLDIYKLVDEIKKSIHLYNNSFKFGDVSVFGADLVFKDFKKVLKTSIISIKSPEKTGILYFQGSFDEKRLELDDLNNLETWEIDALIIDFLIKNLNDYKCL